MKSLIPGSAIQRERNPSTQVRSLYSYSYSRSYPEAGPGAESTDPGSGGGAMSDQADNLRQLVRAQRLWRELLREDPPAPVAGPVSGCHARPSGGMWEGARTGDCFGGVVVFAVRALRRVFCRALADERVSGDRRAIPVTVPGAIIPGSAQRRSSRNREGLPDRPGLLEENSRTGKERRNGSRDFRVSSDDAVQAD